MIHKLTQKQVCWIAGFLEGEGCFLTSPTGSPGIKVLSTDKDVLEKYGKWIDRPVRGPYPDHRGNGRKDRWEVNFYGQPAVDLMEKLLPYMGQRRSAKIRDVLAAAAERQLKQGVRDKQATCHPKLKRYHSDGKCRNCYAKMQRQKISRRMQTIQEIRDGVSEHSKSIQGSVDSGV